MGKPLEELLDRCRAGDADAVAALVGRFRPQALQEAAGILNDAGLAEDAVQEALIAALDRLNDLRTPAAFPVWLRRIVRTHALRIARKQRERSLSSSAAPGQQAETPWEGLHRNEVREQVVGALRALGSPNRETAELFYLDERSCSEIAHILRVPSGTVKRRLYDARRQLRGMLLGCLGDDTSSEIKKDPGDRRLPL